MPPGWAGGAPTGRIGPVNLPFHVLLFHDPAVAPWLLALGTVAALTLAGRLGHRRLPAWWRRRAPARPGFEGPPKPPAPARVAVALAEGLDGLRLPVQSLLREAGVRLDWRIDASAEAVVLPPRTHLGLMRLVQDALEPRAVQARGTTRVTLWLAHAPADAGLRLRLAGDGPSEAGAQDEAARRCAREAHALGAALQAGPREDGTGWCWEIRLPLPARG